MNESQDHQNYISYLNRKQLFFNHFRTDKKTTNMKGWPDFTVMENGRSLFVEFKQKGNHLSPDQVKVKEILELKGFKYALCYSLENAINATETWLATVYFETTKPLDCQGIPWVDDRGTPKGKINSQ